MESEALAKEPEDSVVEDMRLILRMIELALRNVDVAYEEEQNAYSRDVWSRLQSRLLCLRCAAMSASWKPEFLAVLKRARFARAQVFLPFGVSVLRNFDNDVAGSDESGSTTVRCVACASTKELTVNSIHRSGGFELVGKSISHTVPVDDCLLYCPLSRLRECLIENLNSTQLTISRNDATEPNPEPNPLYRGFFVPGAKCTRLALAFVWLQNFLPDLAHRIEEELEKSMTEEMLQRPPDDVSVVTKEMARFVVLQLEGMETFLREGVDRVVVMMPEKLRLSPDDPSLYTDELRVWDNVSLSNKRNIDKAWKLYSDSGGHAPKRPAWFSEEDYGKWTEPEWFEYHNIHNRLKCAMESMQTKIPDKPSPTPSAHSTPEDPSEDEEDDETTDETSEADERTLRRKRREHFRRKRRESTMQAESEPPPRRRRAAVVEDEDEQEDEVEEEEAETGDAEAQTDDDGNLEDEAQKSNDGTEVNMAVFDAREGMLCEIVRRAHESTAYKMRLAVDQGSVTGTYKAQREYEAQMDMARHLQTTFKLGRIV